MIFWVVSLLCTINLIFSIYTFITKQDIAHLACSSIYWVVLCPLFAFFRWRRMTRCIRFVPALFFFGVALYISLGCLGINKKMMNGFLDGEDQFLTLYGCYIIAVYIYARTDFKLSLFVLFPMYLVADIILCLSRYKRYQIKISMIPEEYHRFVDPIVASQ